MRRCSKALRSERMQEQRLDLAYVHELLTFRLFSVHILLLTRDKLVYSLLSHVLHSLAARDDSKTK